MAGSSIEEKAKKMSVWLPRLEQGAAFGSASRGPHNLGGMFILSHLVKEAGLKLSHGPGNA